MIVPSIHPCLMTNGSTVSVCVIPCPVFPLCPGASDGGVQYCCSGLETEHSGHVWARQEQRCHERIWAQGVVCGVCMRACTCALCMSECVCVWYALCVCVVCVRVCVSWIHPYYIIGGCYAHFCPAPPCPTPRWSSTGWANTTMKKVWPVMTSHAPTSPMSEWPIATRHSARSWNLSSVPTNHTHCTACRKEIIHLYWSICSILHYITLHCGIHIQSSYQSTHITYIRRSI